jgi:hypothetical protein
VAALRTERDSGCLRGGVLSKLVHGVNVPRMDAMGNRHVALSPGSASLQLPSRTLLQADPQCSITELLNVQAAADPVATVTKMLATKCDVPCAVRVGGRRAFLRCGLLKGRRRGLHTGGSCGAGGRGNAVEPGRPSTDRAHARCDGARVRPVHSGRQCVERIACRSGLTS